MDIKSFAVSPTARLELRDATDEIMRDDAGNAVAVNLYGPGSKQYTRAQAAQSNRMIDKLKRKGKSEQTAEQMAAEKAEFLADCTQSFENLEYDKLAGRELAVAVFGDISIGFIADQVAKFLGDWSNFSKGSATS